MSDFFIDDLHERLTRDARRSGAGNEVAATARWWEELVEVMGQKVGAWNERQAPHPPVNFTRQRDDAVSAWHRSAEVTVTRDGNHVRVSTRLGSEPVREVVADLLVAADVKVVASVGGNELLTPTQTAEYVLEPLLIETFARP